MDETILQGLVDESDLRKLMLALPRCLDTRDWEGLGNLFTEDATMNVHGLIRTGRETIVAGPRGDLERLYEATQHIIGNIYVDVNGDEASIVAYCFGGDDPQKERDGKALRRRRLLHVRCPSDCRRLAVQCDRRRLPMERGDGSRGRFLVMAQGGNQSIEVLPKGRRVRAKKLRSTQAQRGPR